MITGIVVALPEELATLTDKSVEKGHCRFLHDKILVACAGMGPANAAAATELLIAKGVSRLISWGCAGALDPSLRPGDLVFADRLLNADNEELALAGDWFDHAAARLSAALPNQGRHKRLRIGLLTESIDLVDSPASKQRLYAASAALALDMESCAIAETAAKHGLPCLAIRAIADPASKGLPPAVAYATNADGEIALGKLLAHLLFHPGQLPSLIALGLYFGKAKRTLRQAAAQLEAIADFGPHS